MGFKKNNLNIKNLGIEVPKAYAQIEDINIGLNGDCYAVFKIQTSRDAMDKPALDIQSFQMIINKDLPVHKQVYERAKVELFSDWEDDIVE